MSPSLFPSVLLVALGGAVGAVARYGLGRLLADWSPLSTLLANTGGCFLIGLLAALGLPEPWRLAIMLGFLGAFTTYSSFALEVLTHSQNGAWVFAAGYAVATLILALIACAWGYQLGIRLSLD